MVIVHHAAPTRDCPIPTDWHWFVRHGAFGVDVFFAISGFLITTLLLRERDRSGAVSLPDFYLRRTMRIMPPLWSYLAFVAVLQAAGATYVPAMDWVAALTYTLNYFHTAWTPIGHLWSLAVEEHFYLVWPAVFVLLWGQSAWLAAAFCFALQPVSRWLTYNCTSLDIDYVTHTQLDGIVAGCLLAFAANGGIGSSLLKKLDARPLLYFTGAIGVLALSLFVLFRSGKYQITIGPSINAICVCVAIWTSVRFPALLIGPILNFAPIAWIGTISYSLYLCQGVFLHPQNSWWACGFPQNLVFTFLAAAAMHFVVEQPANRLKDWLSHGHGARGKATKEA